MSFKLISFDGYDFNAAGWTIKPPQDSWRGQVGNTVPSSNRPGLLPTLGPASMNARRLTYDVIPPSGTDYMLAVETLITKLRPMDPVPRTLIAEHPDASGTAVQVQRQAVIEMPHGAPGDISADIVRITFVSADPAWRVVTPPAAVTVATNHDSTSWNAGAAYTALGSAPISPDRHHRHEHARQRHRAEPLFLHAHQQPQLPAGQTVVAGRPRKHDRLDGQHRPRIRSCSATASKCPARSSRIG